MEVAAFDDERAFAAHVAPELLGCKSGAQVHAYVSSLGESGTAWEYLAAAVVLSWTLDAKGAYALFARAYDRAAHVEDFATAASVVESHAHHAKLLGDVALAAEVYDRALDLSAARGLSACLLRCAAAAALLAGDAGDLERAARLLALALPHAQSREQRALLAPVALALAAENNDEAALAQWGSPFQIEIALRSRERQACVFATMAALTDAAAPDRRLASAVRRALLRSIGSSETVEIFTLAARHGELDDARLAADALTALVAPERAYIKAHALLARAQVLVRGGNRAPGVDRAGDAARAFSAMGLRRWMNEAMMLLLRPENNGTARARRGRSDGSALTGREEQVAHLIRRGASNREVAAALQISEHTVERHVSSILGRLGLRSRWQIGEPKNAKEY
jgi:DNA-binding CsgD family transcriptional regulator